MTEDEARKRWCPMVRFHNGFDSNVYCSRPTGVAIDDSALCIASDCMMWMSGSIQAVGASINEEGTYSLDGSDTSKHGWCGLTRG